VYKVAGVRNMKVTPARITALLASIQTVFTFFFFPQDVFPTLWSRCQQSLYLTFCLSIKIPL